MSNGTDRLDPPLRNDAQVTPARLLRLLCNLRVMVDTWERTAEKYRLDAQRYRRDRNWDMLTHHAALAEVYTAHAAQLREAIGQ